MRQLIPAMPVIPYDIGPAMPTLELVNRTIHTYRSTGCPFTCVARDVPPRERMNNPKAQASLDLE